MGKKAKLTHVYAKKQKKKSSSSAVSVSFLLNIHQLGSGVQAGATKRRPTTHAQREKNHNRSLWRTNEMVRSALNKKKYR